MGYGTIDLFCDVGGTLSLLMGASLLTCCELLEVAWIYLLQKCFVMFPTTGPVLNNIAKFLLPIAATDDTNNQTSNVSTGSNNVNNRPVIFNRRSSDAEFPTILNKELVTIAIQVPAEEDFKAGTGVKGLLNAPERKISAQTYKLSQRKADLNDEVKENQVSSAISCENSSNDDRNGNKKRIKGCSRRAVTCKTKHHFPENIDDLPQSPNHATSLSSPVNTRRSFSLSPSADGEGYPRQNFSALDDLHGNLKIQKFDLRSKEANDKEQDLSLCSSNESVNTRYLFHHFPPSTLAQKFYRDAANNGGELQVHNSLSTSYVQAREVPKPVYCSKSPPTPNLYVVHASTGPSLSTAYLPNGDANASKSTVTCATSTPISGSAVQNYYCQKRKTNSNCILGATSIRNSDVEASNTKKSSSRKGKVLHLGSEELIV